jgi:hypothetical protein
VQLAPRPAASPGYTPYVRVLRFAAPFALVSVFALAPVWLVALATHAPTTGVEMSSVDRLGYVLTGLAILGQLALVGGAAAIAGATSQLDALGRGVRGVLRAVVPCLLVAVAVAIATLALVVPGLLAIGLFATTGAAALEPGPAAAVLARAAAAARRQLPVVAAFALGAIAVDVAIAVVLRRTLLADGAKHEVGEAIVYFRVVALALVAVSPPIAGVLAACYARNRAR